MFVVFPDHTHLLFCVFDQALHQAARLENLVLQFIVENHAIGIKPVHGIDDAILRKLLKKNGYVFVPDNIDTE